MLYIYKFIILHNILLKLVGKFELNYWTLMLSVKLRVWIVWAWRRADGVTLKGVGTIKGGQQQCVNVTWAHQLSGAREYRQVNGQHNVVHLHVVQVRQHD